MNEKLFAAIEYDAYHAKRGEYLKAHHIDPSNHIVLSVHDLMTPLYQFQLNRSTPDKRKLPFSSTITSLVGTAVHALVESHLKASKTLGTFDELSVTEHMMFDFVDHEGHSYPVVVVGEFDFYDGESARVEDFKVTSFQSRTVREDWIIQLNLYAVLRRANKKAVSALQINELPWRNSAPGLPKFHSIPLFSEGTAHAMMMTRVADRVDIIVHGREPTLCNQTERWGKDLRCTHYCPVAHKCPYGSILINSKFKTAYEGELNGNAKPETEN